MPPHTRSTRRRHNQRNQPRRTASVEAPRLAPSTGTTTHLDDEFDAVATNTAPVVAPTMQRAATARTAPARADRADRAGTRRRVISRPAPEPVDYTKDYAAVRLDLRRILLWAALLFVAMVALAFSGLV